MKVLVTGSSGFIGKNLIERLGRIEDLEILKFDKENTLEELKKSIDQSDFIFHLAGVNRPKSVKEFYEGNGGLTQQVVFLLEQRGEPVPILMTSSIQAERDNDYGKSKRAGEEALEVYAAQTGASTYIYRLPNVFGKWSRPNYNTVIATWCYNISRDMPVEISDPAVELSLVYIDDVVEAFVQHFDARETQQGLKMCEVSPVYCKTLGEIYELLQQFKQSRQTLVVPRTGEGFTRALYATYLSFLPTDQFAYPLRAHRDDRGAFYEFVKTYDSGQISISTTKPGDVVRGNHYHNTKNEKFVVVKGEALIELRNIYSDEVIEYHVSDKKIEVVEMIPGYTHNIRNISEEEMILVIWANEAYDPQNPDTYFLKV